MTASDINDFKHWRERAEELRSVAESVGDPHARASLLAIAEDYEKLAARAEERSKRETSLINRGAPRD
jgi:hypothetical protein